MIRFYLRVFGSALLAILCTAAAASGPKGALSQQDIARHSQLLSKASQQKALRVVVELRSIQLDVQSLTSAAQISSYRSNLESVRNRVIDRLRSNRSNLRGTAGSSIDDISSIGIFPGIVLVASPEDLTYLLSDQEVYRIYEDKLRRPTLADTGPMLGLRNGTYDGFKGNNQAVAILDTGIDKNHQYLNGRVISEACFSSTFNGYPITSVCPNGVPESTANNSGLNCPTNVSGCDHGTHVGGIVASQLSGAYGISNGSNLISIQVFSRIDDYNYCYPYSSCVAAWDSDIVKGLDRVYALRDTYRISSVNLSLGGGEFSSYCDSEFPPFKSYVDLLRQARIATVVASGNDGFTSSISWPACVSGTISVGSTDKANLIAYYSNSASILSSLAPGSYINSTVPGGGLQSMSGTSMAAPHVAAGFAVLKEVDPTASVDAVFSTLTSMGDPIYDARNGITKQRIHLGRAVAAMDVRTRLANGTPIFGNGAAGNVPRYLSVVVPTGATNLSISTSGGTGDPTLYVRHATRPTTAVYTCRSANAGSSEFCSFPSPSAGTYHIMLHSPSAFSDVRVDANYDFNCSGSSIVTLGSLYNSTSEVTTCAPIHSSSTTTEATATAVLQLNSGDGIVLKPGFKVRRGGRLWARVYN